MDTKLSLCRELAKQIISVTENGNKEFQPTPIAALNLSSRAFNSLQRGGIDFIEQLIWLDRNAILRMRNMGQKSFNEINKALERLGLKRL